MATTLAQVLRHFGSQYLSRHTPGARLARHRGMPNMSPKRHFENTYFWASVEPKSAGVA